MRCRTFQPITTKLVKIHLFLKKVLERIWYRGSLTTALSHSPIFCHFLSSFHFFSLLVIEAEKDIYLESSVRDQISRVLSFSV